MDQIVKREGCGAHHQGCQELARSALRFARVPQKNSGFMNIHVANIQACYELWRSRGAEFITEPRDKYGKTLCYIRDPDGYIIEVGQSKPDFTYG